ncbi:hypothetical protein ABZS96_17675 [Streptomyces avermitilis]|uniref:hypothetical protein n=1 Tax=Streptomyces avermitilis TaxID=33903 RepID=UPI0033A23160
MLFVVLAVLVALGAVVTAVVLMANGSGDGSTDKKSPAESSKGTGRSPTPSLSIPSAIPTEIPTELPSGFPSKLPSGLPSDFPSDFPSELPSGLESLFAAPAGDEVPYYMLKKGDCFDTGVSRPGQAAKRACHRPHDAEVVKVTELKGGYATDAALKKAASGLCEAPLAHEEAQQAAGTVRGTLVQYPDTTGYKLGIDKVACSLAADVDGGDRKFTAPLK